MSSNGVAGSSVTKGSVAAPPETASRAPPPVPRHTSSPAGLRRASTSSSGGVASPAEPPRPPPVTGSDGAAGSGASGDGAGSSPKPSATGAGGAGAGAGSGAGSGSSSSSPTPSRARRRSSAASSDMCLTRLFRDRVQRFKNARDGRGGGPGLSVDVDAANTRRPSAVLTSPLASPMDRVASSNALVNRLPRGGYTVDTPAGPVQVGAPPETIKDHMSMGLTVPTFYVVPQQRFDPRTFVNLAEIEFPTFFNFFVLKKKVCIIATPEAITALRTSFKEGLLGPATIDTSDEFDVSVPEHVRPDLRKELDWFSRDPFNPGKHMNVDTLIKFMPLTRPEGGGPPQVDLGSGVVVRMEGLPDDSDAVALDAAVEYVFLADGEELARVPDAIALPDLSPSAMAMFRPFQPPTFGFTFLGTSHGFDPNGQTTGFVIWVNGKGVMVDPPPHSSLLLKMMGIPPRLIDTLILTHCHADHDAGTLQKVLEEGQVTIMATATVIGSFVRKYSALTGISQPMMRELFKFRPVRVGAFMPYRSAHFRFFYALHAIPCTGFEVHLGGESMVYSADTFNDPAGIKKMFEAGVMTAGRRDALINFPWYHSVVLHEAGVPPIHTPVTYLASLPEQVKRRIRLVHVAPNAVPRGQGLQLAREGPEHTIRLGVQLPPLAQAINLLDLVSNLRFLQVLSLADARLLLQLGYVRTFAAGKPITVRHAGSPLLSKHNEFFMIASGVVRLEVGGADAAGAGAGASSDGSRAAALVADGTRERATTRTTTDLAGYFTTGDYFPRELLRVQPTDEGATAVRSTKLVGTALTEVQCVVFNELEFWRFLTDHGVLKDPAGDAYLASEHACSLNKALSNLTARQRKVLRSALEPARTLEAGEALWTAGQACSHAFLLSSGSASVSTGSGTGSATSSYRAAYGAGALFAEVNCMRSNGSHTTSVRAMTKCSVFPLGRAPFMDFLRRNPSFLLATSARNSVVTA